MRPIYLKPITNLEEAKALFADLHETGKLFHPDDAPDSIVTGWLVGMLTKVFTHEEAAELERRMEEVREQDWSEWGGVAECPCGYLMEVYPPCVS